MMSGEFRDGPPLNPGEASAALLRGEWPDLYLLLGVSPDADEETLRRRIRESYIEATTNADHRNIARRIHYQTMAETVLPQCHRILLDTTARAAYDEQSRLHREGDARAREYSSFISNTLGDDETKTRDENSSMILGSVGESKSDTHLQEMEEARAMLESLGRSSRREQSAPRNETPPARRETRELSTEPYNREDESLRARYRENSKSTEELDADLASRGAETPRSVETPRATPARTTRENNAVDAHLSARLASPETEADLASVSEPSHTGTAPPAATEPPASTATTPSPPEAGPTVPKTRLSDRAYQRHENAQPAAKAAPDDDPFPLASITAPQEDVASTRAIPETKSEEQAKTEADIARLKNEIAARRSARTQPAAGIANKEERSVQAPPAREANTSAAARIPAPDPAEPAASTDDFTVPEAYRSEKIGDVSPDLLPAFDATADSGAAVEGVTSTREETGITTTDIARDFSDAPSNAARARTIFAPRVSLGENPDSVRAVGSAGQRKRVFSQTAMYGLVAVIAAAATLIIFRPGQNNAPVLTPVSITCTSEVASFLRVAENAFETSAEGDGIDISLSPIDSRDAMRHLLTKGATSPDVWIPSEALWNERYNQVSAQSGGKQIRVARSLALSPIVLLAHSDQAVTLRRRFPGRIIPSWQALQDAVKASANGHFGLTDPIKSSSGSITRLFMAREWCEKNGVEWNEKALSDKRLWQWMQGFENNVPSYGKLTSDMARDLALGTADRYWWALVYESDAIYWMKQSKDVEMFYLPVSNFADHPFCRMEGGGGNAQARDKFEGFLRAAPMQKVLLESGFRPTEVTLSQGGAGNPFNNPDLRKRGLKIKGFRIDDRIPYKLLNALNAQWAQRYKG